METPVEYILRKLKPKEWPKEHFERIYSKEIKIAKAMYKEQIIESFWKGEFNQGCNGDGEQYYNELFEKK